MIPFKTTKIVLQNHEPSMAPSSNELAAVVLARIGLEPRKKGATENMYRVLVELYERSKRAYRKKRPENAVMTVEEMGYFAGISRQTMYDYLNRWTSIRLIAKTSYIADGRVVIGYKLSGNTLEQAFDKVTSHVRTHMDITQRYIRELQRLIKNEKIAESQSKETPTEASVEA